MNHSPKTIRSIYILIIVTLIICVTALAVYYHQYNETVTRDTQLYLKEIYRIERQFIENIPVFENFTTPAREKRLRKFLLKAHLKAAKKYGTPSVRNDDDIKKLEARGKLIKLESDPELFYYFYNVREKYRYLTPMAARGLEIVTQRLQENLQRIGDLPVVKIAISSATRPRDYQKGLTKRNINASIESTHYYGTSFDIFFDDFYISFPEPYTDNSTSKKLQEQFKRRFGFLIGDALRRQFHSILMETLIQLQDEGILYAILERKQHCYHVTIIK